MTESFSDAVCPLGNECTLPNQECQITATGVAVTTAGAGQTCACSAPFAQNAAGYCGKLLHVTNRK